MLHDRLVEGYLSVTGQCEFSVTPHGEDGG